MDAPRDHRFRRRVTAWDVARAAGVNQSVVSRAFDPKAKVAPETRQRLLALAKELGYAPNALARGLLTGRTRLVGITTVQINLEISSQLLQKLGRLLLSENLHPLLLPLGEGQDLTTEVHRLFNYDIDALVLVSASISPALLETCTSWGRPVILVNRFAPENRLHSVRTDDLAGGIDAARHLAATGARTLAFLSGPSDATSSTERGRGFQIGLEQLGIKPPRTLAGDFTYASGLKVGTALFAKRTRPDAIFCANDMMALGLMDAAREAGVRIPDDIQVVGFDDVLTASLKPYELTTLRHDLDAIARQVVRTLALLEDDRESLIVDQCFPARLIKRRSTR